MTSRKLMVAGGAILGVLALAAAGRIAMYLVGHEYKAPERPAASTPDLTPREKGIEDETAAVEKAEKEKPYVEAEYRAFPRSCTSWSPRSCWRSRSSP
jgi:hypothetical protein